MANYVMADAEIGRIVTFRLKRGTDLLEGLTEVCRDAGIKNGAILSVLGSLNNAYFCNPVELPETKPGYGYGEILHLTGPIELTGASGIVCHSEDGEINLHVHVSLSDRHGNGYGGHLSPGTKVLLTVEGAIAEIKGVEMTRHIDPETGLPSFMPIKK